MKTIPDDIMHQMKELGVQVREALKQGNAEEAQSLLEQGWQLIPEPKSEYNISISKVLASIRLMAQSGKPSLALEWIEELKHLPISAIDAEPDFLTGITHFELGNMGAAFQHFDRSSKMSKGRCFEGEDKKYIDFYKKRLGGK
ncbi:MAG: hypothetical protein ACOYMG_14010 [Candidatus Methylumidiphilus sp.]